MHFRFHPLLYLCLFAFLVCFPGCNPAPGKSEETTCIRVIAHDDTAFMQQQKLLCKNRVLVLLGEGAQLESLENILLKDGFPVRVRTAAWAPSPPYPKCTTILIMLGNGKGHNWWGVLNPEIYRSPLFQTQQKSSVAFRDAAQEQTIVFPILDSLFRFWKKTVAYF